MCGFVGFTGMRAEREAILHRMADRIIHRGPDMEGYHLSGDTPENAVALGFRRLSILDLTEAGAQPMANEDGSVVIVFNGEIYNFQELRSELEAKGYNFHCGADTESLRQWGLVNLPVYGTSEARRALLMEVVELLAADGYLAITEGKFPLVGFGPRYREAAEPDFALSIKQTPKVRKGSAAKLPKSARAGAADLTEADVELFERLRALRLRLAQEAGMQICTLGPRILRCETAPLAVLSAVMTLTGNLE